MIEYFYYLGGAVVVLVAIMAICHISHRHFQKRWPSISDEEFLTRCPPGVKPEVALRVRQIISTQLNIPYDQIHPEQRFIEDLDAG